MFTNIKTILAIIGVFYTGTVTLKLYNRHVKVPLERKLTEIFDDEAKATEEWTNKQRSKVSEKIKQIGNEISRKAFEKAIAEGKTEAEAVAARDHAFSEFMAAAAGL